MSRHATRFPGAGPVRWASWGLQRSPFKYGFSHDIATRGDRRGVRAPPYCPHPGAARGPGGAGDRGLWANVVQRIGLLAGVKRPRPDSMSDRGRGRGWVYAIGGSLPLDTSKAVFRQYDPDRPSSSPIRFQLHPCSFRNAKAIRPRELAILRPRPRRLATMAAARHRPEGTRR
jgi:hypothetical protein